MGWEKIFEDFNIFSIFDHIGPALRPEPLTLGSSKLQFW
jgi:hypothetical protein